MPKMLQACLLAAAATLIVGCDSASSPETWKEYALTGSYSANFSKNSQFATIGSFNHGGSLWQMNNHERLFNWNHEASGFSIIAATAFSPDEQYAATANQQDLVLWNTQTGQSEGFWSSPAEIMQMDLSPNGDFALLGLADHTAVYFDVKNGGVNRMFRHDARVRSVDLSDDASLAITGSDAFNAKLWSVETGEMLQQMSFGNVVDTVAISADNRYLFSAASLDKAVIWDVNSGQTIHTLSDFGGFFQKRVSFLSARFSNDNSQLLTGTASGLVQLWDVQSGTQLKQWRIHRRDAYGPVQAGVYSVSFGQGKYYAAGSNGIINELK